MSYVSIHVLADQNSLLKLKKPVLQSMLSVPMAKRLWTPRILLSSNSLLWHRMYEWLIRPSLSRNLSLLTEAEQQGSRRSNWWQDCNCGHQSHLLDTGRKTPAESRAVQASRRPAGFAWKERQRGWSRSTWRCFKVAWWTHFAQGELCDQVNVNILFFGVSGVS